MTNDQSQMINDRQFFIPALPPMIRGVSWLNGYKRSATRRADFVVRDQFTFNHCAVIR